MICSITCCHPKMPPPACVRSVDHPCGNRPEPSLRAPAALPARARRKASSSLTAAEAAPGNEAPGCELYPVPCNLGVVAMDESTIELNFCPDGDEHGVHASHPENADELLCRHHSVPLSADWAT